MNQRNAESQQNPLSCVYLTLHFRNKEKGENEKNNRNQVSRPAKEIRVVKVLKQQATRERMKLW